MTPPIYFDIEMNNTILTLIISTVNYFDLEIVFLYKKPPVKDRRLQSSKINQSYQ